MEPNLDWYIIDHALNNAFWASEGAIIDLGDFANNGEGRGDVVIA